MSELQAEVTGIDLGSERPEPTGVERVDAVLDAVAGLGDQPVAEHVAVFEQAHTELRAALDAS